MFITVHFSATALDAAAGRDRSLVRLVVLPELLATDLEAATISSTRREQLRSKLAGIADRDEVGVLALVAPDGTVLVSTDETRDGTPIGASEPWSRAASGQVGSEIRSPDAAATGSTPDGDTMLVEYFPLTTPASGANAVVVVERSAAPILARLEATRRDILLVTVGAAAFLALLLVSIFRAAHVRAGRGLRSRRRGRGAGVGRRVRGIVVG